jgi:hypothetical protein
MTWQGNHPSCWLAGLLQVADFNLSRLVEIQGASAMASNSMQSVNPRWLVG